MRAHWKVLLAPQAASRSRDSIPDRIAALVQCQSQAPILLELRSEQEIQQREQREKENHEQVNKTPRSAALSPAQASLYHKYLRSIREASASNFHTPTPGEATTRYYVEADGFEKPHKLPRFFSWVVPTYLAGLSTPRNPEDILALESLGIVLLVTLTEETPLPKEWFTGRKIRNVFYPVRNLHGPTIEEMDSFFKEIDDVGARDDHSESSRPPAIAVHCGGGVGRAGTFLACYLVRHGASVAKPFCEPCRRTAARLNRAVRSTECSEECPNSDPPKMGAAEAIELLRVGRPGSLETKWQEEFVKKYTGILWSRYLNPGDEDRDLAADAGERDLPLAMTGKPVKPSFVVLVGLPGSGKSWLAEELVTRSEKQQQKWIRVCQDVLGSRESCRSAVSSNCKQLGKVRVVLDRCNPTAAERKEWLQLAFNPREAVAVYFSASLETCEARISSRFGHETIRAGGGKFALRDMSKRMEPPTLGEGFAAIYRVHSYENALSLVEKWTSTKSDEESKAGKKKAPETKNSAAAPAPAPAMKAQVRGAKTLAGKSPASSSSASSSLSGESSSSAGDDRAPGIEDGLVIKFPRTEHLFSTGGTSVSSDDIVADTSRALEAMANLKPGQSLHLEEKIDGGNMGFSLGSDYRIQAQNRSHYITAKEQRQYELLDYWITMRKQRLMFVLGEIPGKRILFGEWLVAQHSLHYTKLPDEFIAFDILDVESRRFYSRERFDRVIEEANGIEAEGEPVLHRVPRVARDEKMNVGNKNQWMQLLMASGSALREGCLEGIYIRIDEGEWLRDRMKLVRPDFVAGNENWSKHKITKNIVLHEA